MRMTKSSKDGRGLGTLPIYEFPSGCLWDRPSCTNWVNIWASILEFWNWHQWQTGSVPSPQPTRETSTHLRVHDPGKKTGKFQTTVPWTHIAGHENKCYLISIGCSKAFTQSCRSLWPIPPLNQACTDDKNSHYHIVTLIRQGLSLGSNLLCHYNTALICVTSYTTTFCRRTVPIHTTVIQMYMYMNNQYNGQPSHPKQPE
jgi:hypothetical protein